MNKPVQRRRATIRDVAAHLGLSTSTVSAALNGSGVLKDSTRERVREAAEELGYRPSRTALAFRLGRTSTIAYSLPVVDEGAFSVLGVETYIVGARAAASTAFEHGYALTLTPPQLRGEDAWNLIGADGVVLCDPEENDERLLTLERLGVPVVTIERDVSRPDWPFMVSSDFERNMVLMLDHLHSQGARKIALLLPEGTWSSTLDNLVGYSRWAREHNMAEMIRRVPTASAQNDAYSATVELLSNPDRPDAIIASAEQFRARMFDAIRDLGVQVPQQLLVAVGGDSETSRHGDPTVTAIGLQPELLSELAVKMLIQRIDGEPHDGPIVLEGALNARRSSQAERNS